MEPFRIVVWSDSIGAQPPLPQWPELCQNMVNYVVNRGREAVFTNISVCGRAAVCAKSAFETDVAPVKPDLVIIQFGYNDLRYELSGEGKRPLGTIGEYEAALKEMIASSRKIGAKVLLLGNHQPFCYDLTLPSGCVYPEAVATYREAARRVAAACNADYIDMSDIFLKSKLAPENLTVDGVHLSHWGKRLYAVTIANYLSTVLV